MFCNSGCWSSSCRRHVKVDLLSHADVQLGCLAVGGDGLQQVLAAVNAATLQFDSIGAGWRPGLPTLVRLLLTGLADLASETPTSYPEGVAAHRSVSSGCARA